MMFTTKLALSILALAGLTYASPIAETADDLIVLQSESLSISGFSGNSTLTWYGQSPLAKRLDEASLAPSACGTNDLNCATNQKAPTTVCTALAFAINKNVGVPTTPRSICMSTSEGQCCISWSKDAPGLVSNELFPGAAKVNGDCANYVTAGVSGYTANTLLHGVCLHQCLSNRPGGC